MDRIKVCEDLKRIEGLRVMADAPMSRYTSFRIGGPAACLAEPENEAALQAALRYLAERALPHFILGQGSDLLVRDEGYEGVVLRLGRLQSCEIAGTELRAGAGCTLVMLALQAAEAGLSGLEFASGIPGSLGGALFMNAGAYDGSLGPLVREVRLLAADGSAVRTAAGAEMDFAYRHSRLMESGEVALSAVLSLSPGDRGQIRARMDELRALRNSKQPVQLPSAGSFFKRPPGQFAGKLIEEAGLKGLRLGDAQVSDLHAGFIVNLGSATAADVISLMNIVITIVEEKSGVRLEPEVRIL